MGCHYMCFFFGFLRSSQFIAPYTRRHEQSTTLLYSDVSLVDNLFHINIKASKTDPFSAGLHHPISPNEQCNMSLHCHETISSTTSTKIWSLIYIQRWLIFNSTSTINFAQTGYTITRPVTNIHSLISHRSCHHCSSRRFPKMAYLTAWQME